MSPVAKNNPVRFSYTLINDPSGGTLQRPVFPVQLTLGSGSININALLDTGADANILPFQLGLTLGLSWVEARSVPSVSGNLGQAEARAVTLKIVVQPFAPVTMVFIWVRTDAARSV